MCPMCNGEVSPNTFYMGVYRYCSWRCYFFSKLPKSWIRAEPLDDESPNKVKLIAARKNL